MVIHKVCIIFLLISTFFQVAVINYQVKAIQEEDLRFEPYTYNPTFDAFNLKEEMTLSPIFTPDNALLAYVSWLKKANTSIDIQNQYIRLFESESWHKDTNPIVIELVAAVQRGVMVRVQIREDSDNDNVADFLIRNGISVRYMGSQSSDDGDESYLSQTHNKLVIIDSKLILISSINFSENGFTNNREAGMIIINSKATDHFKSIFENDWNDGEIASATTSTGAPLDFGSNQLLGFTSHTNIPRTNFTGVYNITLFTNPDNADTLIFDYLQGAKESIYVSMYTISRPDFNDTLISLKKLNPSLDIQVLISQRRVGSSEEQDTHQAAASLVKNLIPVFQFND